MSNYFIPPANPAFPGAPVPNPAAYNPMAAATQQFNYAAQQQQAYQHFQAATNPQTAQTAYGMYGSAATSGGASYATGPIGSAPQAQRPPQPAAVAAPKPISTTGTPTAGAPNSYTGYDAAVYAAATSYLQSKTGGGSNSYIKQQAGTPATGANAGGGGGGGTFPQKGIYQSRYSGGRSGGYGGGGGGSGVQQVHYCELCKISCAGPAAYKDHLEGIKHKKRDAAEKSGAANPGASARNKLGLICELCNVPCSGPDIYQAHIKGAKHQKTLQLHKKLGKPIPSEQPTLIAPSGTAAGVKQAMGTEATRKVVGVPNMSFIGGNKLIMTKGGMRAEVKTATGGTANDEQTAAAYAAIMAEDNIQPVGEAYIEQRRDPGMKTVQMHCKLCDCNFTDVGAKNMHLKGRRHRLAYKKKVDPSLEVDIKPSFKSRRSGDEKNRRDLMRMRQQELWSMRAMYSNQAMAPLHGAATGPPAQPYGPVVPVMGPRGETLDDTHVMLKHQTIYPTEDELSAVQALVINTEKALKACSDWLHQQTLEELKKHSSEETKVDPKAGGERFLKGVMRVGLLAKGLLLKGDTDVQLVVLCSQKPNKTIVMKICGELPNQLKKITPDTVYDVVDDMAEACINVSTTTPPRFTAKVVFTSTLHREDVIEADESGMSVEEVDDLLNREKCLDALAELRHAKWFQARCANLQPALIVMRIMRDICQRINTWTALPIWALELLVEKVLSSAGQPLSPGDAIRRTFEAVAAVGAGLLDPCEKEVTDAVASLEPQRREDITSSAQHALRLIAFNQLHKILAVDRYKPDGETGNDTRKRAAETTDAGNKDSKKKPEEGDGTSTEKPMEEKVASIAPAQ